MKPLFTIKKLIVLVGLLFVLNGCGTSTPTATPFPTANYETPIVLPTYTPVPFSDPALLDLKKLLKEAVDKQDRNLLQNTVSFTKWVGAIYRTGGTAPIDPPRGLALTLNFIQENPVTMDIERPTYEPVWSVPAGDTSVLALVTPKEGEPYYAHFYIQREPSAWRFTGIMTRIPYYDAPSVAQLRADPNKYDGKEFMFVGEYQPKTKPPAGAGTAPDDAVFVLDTFSGPLWISLSHEKYVPPLPAAADTLAGQVVRVFGTVKINGGAPYLLIDSFQFVNADTWAHSGGVIASVDTTARNVTVKPAAGSTATVLQLTETSFISLTDGTRAQLDAIKAGQSVDATGVPQKDGTLLVEELFVK